MSYNNGNKAGFNLISSPETKKATILNVVASYQYKNKILNYWTSGLTGCYI